MKEQSLAQRVVDYIIRLGTVDFVKLNVNEIAKHFHVTPSHLSRTFTAQRNMSLKEFIVREKINRSRFLLKQNRRLTVKDVAAVFDFCSCDYFIRVFKRYSGTTPGKFRQLNGGFPGLIDKRNGPVDRRKSKQDRRKGTDRRKVNIEVAFDRRGTVYQGDRRRGPEDRRLGTTDRRFSPLPI